MKCEFAIKFPLNLYGSANSQLIKYIFCLKNLLEFLLRCSCCTPRQLRQPTTTFREISVPSLHPQIHGFLVPGTISPRLIHLRARDFSYGATKSSDFSCRVRFPAPTTQNDARWRNRSHHSSRLPREMHATCANPRACHSRASTRAAPPMSTFPLPPHLPRETHTQQRQNGRFTAPATRIHCLASSQTPICIRSPTSTTRHVRPPSSSDMHHPPFPTPATWNAIPRIVAPNRGRPRMFGAHAAKRNQTRPRPKTAN